MRSSLVIGDRFARLVVTGRGEIDRWGNRPWIVRCDCGWTHSATASQLRRGHTKSCGCLNTELRLARNLKHGHARRGERHPLYSIWQAMIRRCEDPRHADYALYGGRGVGVCARWRHDFVAFLTDLGPRPTRRHSIDRINNDGNYEPGNCRWATSSEQARNRRSRYRHRGEAAAR